MSRGPDAATLLDRVLSASAARAGLEMVVTSAESTRWASATFTGARHVLEVDIAGNAAAAWLAELPEADLPMRRHLVADLAVVRQARSGARIVATIEALTVEER